MKRFALTVLIAMLVLAGCVAVEQPGAGSTASASAPVAASATVAATSAPSATISGPIVMTVTAVPGVLGTPGPAVTLTPTAPLTDTVLRYQVIAGVGGEVDFCDPDKFPVERGDEPARALAWFDSAGASSDEVQTIARVNNLGDPTKLSDEQKLFVYREHKKLSSIFLQPTTEGYTFQTHIPSGFIVNGTLDHAGHATVTSKQPSELRCPICLSGDTRIDTPGGAVPVRALRPGMAVWTADAGGQRVLATIVSSGRVAVGRGHVVVHVRLSDGRELRVSPGHPTADGRRLGDLRPGDVLDGARVVSSVREPLGDDATYDILPSGPTGFYWANGVLMASTLSGR